MHLILTGATGLVGTGVLAAVVKMKEVTKVSILSRRPVKMAEDLKDPRINVIIHKDFETYDAELLSQLKDAKGCVWALGASQRKVSEEEYVKITKDYAVAASKAFQTLASEEQPFNFVYVSGEGATLEPGRWTQLYGRVNGETEAALAGMRKANPLLRALSVRPALVDPGTHDAIHPYLPGLTNHPAAMRAVVTLLGPPMKMLIPGLHSPTQDIGRVYTQLAMGRHADQLAVTKDVQMVGDFPILPNTAIRSLAALGK